MSKTQVSVALESDERSGQTARVRCPVFISVAAFMAAIFSTSAIDLRADWPGWRGPNGDGIAAPGQNPPLQWNETENVVWKAPIPGRGHGSPTVVGNDIYLATSDAGRGSQLALCFDRANGQLRWQTEVHAEGGDPGSMRTRRRLLRRSRAMTSSCMSTF